MSAWADHKKRLKEFRDGVKPWHLLDPENYADEQVAAERFDICKGCDRLTEHTLQCRECGCFMAAKTKLKMATCPLGKW